MWAFRASSLLRNASSLGSAAAGVTFRCTPSHLVRLVGAPTCAGQPLAGTDAAPTALRQAGLHEKIEAQGWAVADDGDAVMASPRADDPHSPVGGKNAYAVGVSNRNIATAVEAAARRGEFVLTLGGDHSVAMGSVAGQLMARPDLGVLWIDAHADINEPSTSPSGNIHGMPLSFLMKLWDTNLMPGFEWMARAPPLLRERLVYVGLRDLDPVEKRAVRSLGLTAYTMHEVDRYGIGKVMEMALDKLGTRPLHLSYDIDAVDPSLAPSTGTRVQGGLNFREAHYIAESAALTGNLCGMDMVEINPSLNSERAAETVSLGIGLIGSALGSMILP